MWVFKMNFNINAVQICCIRHIMKMKEGTDEYMYLII